MFMNAYKNIILSPRCSTHEAKDQLGIV